MVIAPTEESLAVYILILIFATLNTLWVQRLIKTNWFYTGTIVWAFVAVAIGAQEKGSSIISTIATFAAVLVITYALWEAKKEEFKKMEI